MEVVTTRAQPKIMQPQMESPAERRALISGIAPVVSPGNIEADTRHSISR